MQTLAPQAKQRQTKRLTVLAHHNISKILEQQGRSFRKRKKVYLQVIVAFEQHQSKMSPYERARIRSYPARAIYKLAMPAYKRYLSSKIKGKTIKRQTRELRKIAHQYTKIVKQLTRIARYKSPTWLLCALFRIAQGKQRFIEMIRQARNSKAARSSLQFDYSVHLEDDVVKRFRHIARLSRRLGISNECSRRAREELHRYDPKVPLQRVAQPKARLHLTSPLPLLKVLPRTSPQPKPAKRR